MNHFDSLNLLLENGASLNTLNKNGASAFLHIILNDHVDLLECVFRDAIAYYMKSKSNKQNSINLFHHAAGSRGSKCLKFLLKKFDETGDALDHLTMAGNQKKDPLPLHFAIVAQNQENVNMILKYVKKDKKKLAAMLSYGDVMGNHAIIFAVGFGNAELTATLEQYGADATVPNDLGKNAISICLELQ